MPLSAAMVDRIRASLWGELSQELCLCICSRANLMSREANNLFASLFFWDWEACLVSCMLQNTASYPPPFDFELPAGIYIGDALAMPTHWWVSPNRPCLNTGSIKGQIQKILLQICR
jgi:hypothetical protein